MSVSAQRYTAVAIVLHWAIAIAIFGMIALGWWMGDALAHEETRAQAAAAFQLHKSIGLTILALSLVRLGWRLAHKPPPLPPHMPAWEALAARATHWAFYFLMIAMPLSGWLYVSTAWSAQEHHALNVPTLYFGAFQVPHLFDLSNLAEETRASLAGVFQFSHSKLAWGAIILAALHVGAALKHHFFDQDDVLTHMVPGLKALAGPPPPPPAKGRVPILLGGFGLIALALVGAIAAFQNPPNSNAPAASAATAPAAQTQAPEFTAEVAPADGPVSLSPIWHVNRRASSIQFSGVHAGVPFTGRFSQWSADITFDPANLDAASARVTIQTGSAADGVPLHDQSLPQAEWFDVANHPTATFRTERIRLREGNNYEALGTLTIKGAQIDATLPFTLSIDGNRAVMDGLIEIDRKDVDLGMQSDPDADYVSRIIQVRVHVEAARAP